MRQRFRKLHLVAVVTSVVFASVAAPTPASAYHTERQRNLDGTAYTLHQGEVRLGLLKWGVGIVDQLEVATYTVPWFIGPIFQSVTPNIELKAMFYDRRRLALSATAAVAGGNVLEEGAQTAVRYYVVPLALTSSVRINPRLRLHTGARYTISSKEGEVTIEGQDSDGALVLDVLQFWLKLEIRLSHVTSFSLMFRQVAYAGDSVVQGSAGLDPTTSTAFRIRVDAEDLRAAFAAVVGVNLSWRILNIKVGVGYRNLFLDSVGLVVPLAGPYPYPLFDIFVRF